MSNGRRPRWSQEHVDTVTGVCERSVKGIAGLFKWDEKRAHNLIRGDGEGCDRPCPFTVIAIGAGVVLVQNHGSTVTSAQVSSGLVLCLHAEVFQLLGPNEWDGIFYIKKGIFFVQKVG